VAAPHQKRDRRDCSGKDHCPGYHASSDYSATPAGRVTVAQPVEATKDASDDVGRGSGQFSDRMVAVNGERSSRTPRREDLVQGAIAFHGRSSLP
jgi:hypothetical protein